ncbi:MAG: hypothetical protein ACLRPV_02070 [Lacrimispora saccharolytica]
MASVAWEAVAAAQQNADAANEAGSRLQEASQALGNSSAALSQRSADHGRGSPAGPGYDRGRFGKGKILQT